MVPPKCEKINPIPHRGGPGGGVKVFSEKLFFCKNRIDLKILDFLSNTYTHPVQLKIKKKIIN